MSSNKKFIETLISANNDNSLAIFVGAGISKSSETKTLKLPLWKDLIDDLKRDLNTPDETDYLKIAQLYYLAFGEFTYYNKLKKYFPDGIVPSIVHRQIFEINPHVVITTNWDNILERAVNENAYIYDLVCSDIDLVKSTLQNKLIKMHGDFKNHNLVFKEDDYINYQFNFPLIENYIKSIISTHTVLFLGYSYNDLDLKQIIKWVQNHALDVRPPMYLVTFSRNDNQIKYLESHGIITIVIEDIDPSFLNNADLDPSGQKMSTFLLKIKNKNKNDALEDPSLVTKFILDKLEPLNQLNAILIEQIQQVLSNCGYHYDGDSRAILEFYSNRTTTDYEKNVREIYRNFIEQLKRIDEGEKPTQEMLRIFEILSKARIKGIVLSTEDSMSKEYLPFNEYVKQNDEDDLSEAYDFYYGLKKSNNNPIINFLESAFNQYNLGDPEEALSSTEEMIALCLKHRNYNWLFIAMYNKNVLLDKLTFYTWDINLNEKYSHYEKYDLKERYHNLSKDIRSAMEPVYGFVDFSFIYRYAYEVSNYLKSTQEAKKTIEHGGVVLHNDIYKFSTKHQNLVSFVLRNKLLIENYTEYKSINKSFIEIALLRQFQKENVTLNKTELYSCIRYFKNNELTELFEEFYADSSPRKGKFNLNDLNDWLVNIVLINIAKSYLRENERSDSSENYMQNVLFLLSLSKHSNINFNIIMEQVGMILRRGKNTIGILDSINLFLGVQHSLHQQKIDIKKLSEVIEILIEKFANGKFNSHEFYSMTRNSLSNLFGYAKLQKVTVTNEAIVDRLLLRLNEYPVSEKIDFTQGFLISIYNIATSAVKLKIKNFALAIDITKVESKEEIKKLSFQLYLIIWGFKRLSKKLIVEIGRYLKPYTVKGFSTYLYKLQNQIKFLVEKKSQKDLAATLKVLNSIISKNKDRNKGRGLF